MSEQNATRKATPAECMSLPIVCYAQPDKRKSQVVMEAFAAGCGGTMASTAATELEPGAAAFYGVRKPWMHLWQQALAENRSVYFIDNAFLDAAREKQFRVGLNGELQSWTDKPSDGQRLRALGVQVQPWRQAQDGAIYVCAQSVEFMETHGGSGAWIDDTFGLLKKLTKRPAILRWKQDGEPFSDVLKRAFLVVSHSSAAANEALVAGVPVIVTDPHCAASEFGTPLDRIESPIMRDGREDWAARLADSQWSLEEFKNGTAWRTICDTAG